MTIGWLLQRSYSVADERDEVAPSHCLPRGSGRGSVPAQTCTRKVPTHVSYGSKADMCSAKVMSALGQERTFEYRSRKQKIALLPVSPKFFVKNGALVSACR